MTIDATIQRLTGDGEIIAQFLVDTLQGYTRDATVSHRLKSAEWLAMFGRLIPEDAIPKYASVRPRPKSEPKPDKPGKKPKVTEKQILHFDIARLIKQETNDGETIIEFLIRVISKIEKSGENFTPAARMRAAKELLIRGFGSAIPGINRILSGKTEDLDSYLSKIVREYTDHGADSVRFLVKAMENKTPEVDSKGAQNPYPKFERQRKGKPAEGFTASQRVWAACELLRRAYDIRTDHITPDDIQAYWDAQTSAAVDSSPGIDRTDITTEDIETEATALARASKAGANANNRDKSEKRPAAVKEKPADDNTPSDTPDRAARRRQKRDARKAEKRATTEQPAAAKNIAATEKPGTTTEKRNAADRNIAATANTPSANPGNPGRAARRRQKRADRKAQKRNAANTPIANPIPGIHATDINENTVVFSHEPISPEELTRLRKTLAQPDDIPPNARSP